MPTADLDALLSQAKDYAAQSYARNTLIAYAADWKHFTAWCVEHGRRELPAAPETIICYLVALAETATVATLDRRLSSISFYHTQGRYALPTKDPEVLRTMRGIRRAKGVAPAVKTPILPALLGRMIAVLPDTLRGRRDRAVLLVGFAGAFRRGELVALTIADVEFVDAGLVVTLRRSKTDQEGAARRHSYGSARSDLSSGRVARLVDARGDHKGAALSRDRSLRSCRHARDEHLECGPRREARRGCGRIGRNAVQRP